ncbi:phosphotransferase [Prosthecochloris sp.]|uniref:aminoglycoside phosphotransferase family protein n=1 Tax=Prosthecochloris sp. TaxID=290513 RepID=UPI00257EC7D7|nr:phosphotransferase [Prosthecochloris sp.]
MPPEKHHLELYFSDLELRKLRIEQVAGDASSREYFRVFSPEKTWILCIDPDFGSFPSAHYPFLEIQRLLTRNSVPVPKVIGSRKSDSSILIEDCGNILLQDIISADPFRNAQLYKKSIDCMTRLQSIKGKQDKLPFNRSFDPEKLMFEFDFFITYAIEKPRSTRLQTLELSTLRKEFRKISETLFRKEHFVLNHRDYHSRNILVSKDNLVLIDFQDARMGLPQYDAVSLLKDSYVTLDEQFVSDMQHYHYRLLRANRLTAMDYDEYLYLFDLMAFQRNVKALGTFFHQAYVLEKKEFEQYITPTLAYLPGYISRQPELATAGEIILNTLMQP